MNRNKLVKKAAVVGLSIALAAGQTISGIPYLVNAAEISKQESVYVNLDADGAASDITVTDWIKNIAKTKTIKDSTELTDVFNVKGEETFLQNGNNLDWNAKNEDIYYQGKIDKELPVSMEITYSLDGKEIKANDLAGKSGKLKMHIAYENHAKETVLMDGKQIEINVPFAMLTGVILPTDRFKNVEIDHGKIMSDADKNIIVGIALPGMEESLDLSDDMKEDIEIPSSLTITADVTDFKMGATFTLATTEFMDDIDMTKTTKVDELKDSMDELKDASKKLVSGSADLADGVGTLKDKSGDFTNGITVLSDGLNQLYKGAGSLETCVKSYTAGADQLADGVKKLGSAMKGLPEKLTELATGISTAKTGVNQLAGSTEQLEQGMNTVNGGIDTINTTLGQVNELLSSIEGAEVS